MNNLKCLETPVLVDMLAGHTAEYIRMLREGVPEGDYYECKKMITELQNEINNRQLLPPSKGPGNVNPAENQ